MSAVNVKGRIIGMSAMLALAASALIGLALPAVADASAPSWSVEAKAPTYFRPGKGGRLEAFATAEGSGSTSAVTLRDKLPAGVQLVEIGQLEQSQHVVGLQFERLEVYWTGPVTGPNEVPPGIQKINLAHFHLKEGEPYTDLCSSSTPQEIVCAIQLEGTPLQKLDEELEGSDKRGHGSGKFEPGQTVTLVSSVMAPSGIAEGEIANEATLEESGVALAIGRSTSTVSQHPQFEITSSTFQTTMAEGVPLDARHWGFVNHPVPFTQAGGHPDSLTTTIDFATEDYLTQFGFEPTPTSNPRDVNVVLPPGLLGNPTAVPQCPLEQALAKTECPSSTQIGVATTYMLGIKGFTGPIYNVTPEAGQSAEFMLANSSKVNFLLTAHVARVKNSVTGEKEYGLEVVSRGVPIAEINKVETTFWGEPASEEHASERGLFCEQVSSHASWTCKGGGESSGEGEVPFLTWPSDCAAGAEQALISSDSWEDSGRYVPSTVSIPGATACDLLQFDPGIEASPDTLLADAPVGLGVTLNVPQFEEPNRLATPEIRKTTITLPAGLSVNPGIVDGIQACNEFGKEGINIEAAPSGVDETEEVNKLTGESQLAPGHCPDASIVGTAEAETPLLRAPVKGHVYLATPGCGNQALGQRPCTTEDALDGNLYRLYLELGGTGALANTGVNIKVRLNTKVDPATGQLTSVAEEIAQLPFSKLVVKLNGGPRAPLANSPVCGPAVTTADFTPWAAPGTTPEGVFMPGLGDATPSSFYDVREGCASPPPLAPGFAAGTVTANAGKFSAFTLNISRKDREQYIRGVQVHTPPGLIGVLANVPLCGDAQANAGTCPEASKIGETRVASGAGSHPFEIEGNVYLTGPHDGGPFGLSVVTNVVAGPFNLGKVVVRARIDIDRHDSSLTVTTDETGPYALPQIIFGVPLRLQRITVNIDRERFMLNPTNCKAQRIVANISGSEQAVASVSSPFAVGACRSLAFKPTFKVSTGGHTSRKLGASLDTRLSYPKAALGNDANIARVKVSLPRQLPSFLATLQGACVDATFERNPAACPKGSIVGIARTRTPTLPVSLEGPVYFVSHGGAKFPDLVIVLEGDNIRVDLVGSTFISKGITSSTFETVPDVPVNSFELYLPQGKNHALAANGSLCNEQPKLTMPTEFVAQNGMVIHQRTKVAVTGCGKNKPKKAHGHRKRGRGARFSARTGGSKGRR